MPSIKTKIIPRIRNFYLSIYRRFTSLKLIYRLLILAFAIGLYISFKSFMTSGFTEESKVVEIHKASRETLKVTKKLLGRIEAKRFFNSQAGMNGNISYVAKAGSFLKKGEIIASMNFPEIISSFKDAKEASEIAKSQYLRDKKLLKRGATSRNNVEESYKDLARVNSSLASSRALYDKVEFIAPFDGIVGSPILQEGSYANIGDEIVTFYDNSALIVKFDIPGDIAGKLNKTTKAQINDHEYEVYIQKVLSKNTYSVPAYFEYNCESCLIGDVTWLELNIKTSENALVLPASCVFIKDAEPSIYKVIDDRAILSKVRVGSKQEGRIEIIEGIEDGDLVIKDGQGRLYPNAKVEIHKQ